MKDIYYNIVQVQGKIKMQDQYTLPFDYHIIKQIQPSFDYQKFKEFISLDTVDRALGCLFGSFIGDALGAFLQFKKDEVFKVDIQQVMSMPGGGVFNLKEGQVTDDSQLAFHLLNSFVHFDSNRDFVEQKDILIINIAREYLLWKESKPFDIGITCRKGLQALKKVFQSEKIPKHFDQIKKLQPKQSIRIVKQMHERVYEVNKQSQSNGSLMRITPLPFLFSLYSKSKESEFIHKMKFQNNEMRQFVKNEVKLLHPNEKTVAVGDLWFLLLITLIKRQSNMAIKQIYKIMAIKISQKIPEWQAVIEGKQKINAKLNIGWSKIAFCLGFESLRYISQTFVKTETIPQFNQKLYTSQIFKVLAQGGDTDTNAAIVGGMIGSIIGFKKLPKQYLQKLMNIRYNQSTKTGSKSSKRSSFYQPRKAFANAYLLIHQAWN